MGRLVRDGPLILLGGEPIDAVVPQFGIAIAYALQVDFEESEMHSDPPDKYRKERFIYFENDRDICL